MSSEKEVKNSVVDLVQIDGFRFKALFGNHIQEWTVDEPQPVGTGSGGKILKD